MLTKTELIPVNELFIGIKSNNVNEVSNYMEDINAIFYKLKKQKETERIQRELQSLRIAMSETYSEIEAKYPLAFMLGRFSKEMDILGEETEYALSTRNLYIQFEACRKNTLLIRKNIITYVYKNKGISHGDLAKKLKMSDSSLSNNILAVEEAGLITHEKAGKHKYYYITEKGKIYFDERCDIQDAEIKPFFEVPKSSWIEEPYTKKSMYSNSNNLTVAL